MNRLIYIPLSAAVALVITNGTYEYIYTWSIDNPEILAMSPYAYRPMVSTVWIFLRDLIGVYPASVFLWMVSLALLSALIDEIGARLGRPNQTRTVYLAALVTAVGLVMFQPAGAWWNVFEAIFLAAALIMILDGRTWALYPLVALASLNRETAVFIPLMFLFATRNWKHVAGLGIVWAAVYGGIRLAVGPAPPHMTIPFIASVNFSVAGMGRFLIGLFFVSWLLWYAWKGWKNAAGMLKRAALIIPPYLLLIGIFGVWYEWRLMLSLYPLLVPLAGLGKYRMVDTEMVKLKKITGTPEPLSNIVWHEFKRVKDE